MHGSSFGHGQGLVITATVRIPEAERTGFLLKIGKSFLRSEGDKFAMISELLGILLKESFFAISIFNLWMSTSSEILSSSSLMNSLYTSMLNSDIAGSTLKLMDTQKF